MGGRRTGRLLGSVLLLLMSLLVGCEGDSTGQSFRYDIGPVSNLDPQFATGQDARAVISNIFEGLLVQRADGTLEPGAAESYDVSADGTVYTFHLRETYWSDGSQLTPADFVFTFRRMLSGESLSPYAGQYMGISNAREVAAGEAPEHLLGVRMTGIDTLEITLDQPDPLFPYLLSRPEAAPCNEAFFQQSAGRYGLEEEYLLTNGPFELSGWYDSRIALRASEHYRSDSQALAGGVTFYLGRENPEELLADGKSSVARVGPERYLQLGEGRQTAVYEDTVWCIVFNGDHEVWGNPLFRLALFHALDYDQLGSVLPAGFQAGNAFVPHAVELGGRSYRELAGAVNPVAHDPEKALELLELGLEMMELGSLPTAVMAVPEEHSSYLGQVQNSWQRHLTAFVNLEQASPGEIEEKLQTGDYEMLVMPFSPASGTVSSLLGVFDSGSGQNYFGYYNSNYDLFLEEARSAETLEGMAAGYARAEWQILSGAVVIPLYTGSSFYVADSGVSGLEIFPFGNRVDFKWALES